MTNQISTQTQLSTFNFETHSIRVIAINNEPRFNREYLKASSRGKFSQRKRNVHTNSPLP
ncbi:hypothetical protein [Mannheimia granulomatis]|uniref:hypothetical protein n=1 Tax=Mannheimia granulomatis TaxID=85402 RepID=UPI0014047522|nr:hypothetical protein [Mannheimia granulomatis]